MQAIITDYATHATDIRMIRHEVFVIEQAVPQELEMDDRDAICRHALIYDSTRPLGTGRLDLEKDGKIGRMAVLRAARRQGVGSLILRALEEEARHQGVLRLWCHAQFHAVPFYEKHGFDVCSEPFEEARIRHVAMEKQLTA